MRYYATTPTYHNADSCAAHYGQFWIPLAGAHVHLQTIVEACSRQFTGTPECPMLELPELLKFHCTGILWFLHPQISYTWKSMYKECNSNEYNTYTIWEWHSVSGSALVCLGRNWQEVPQVARWASRPTRLASICSTFASHHASVPGGPHCTQWEAEVWALQAVYIPLQSKPK